MKTTSDSSGKPFAQNRLIDRVTTRLSRRVLMTSGGLTGIGLVASQLDILRSAAQDAPEVRQIIDPLATLEALVVTLIGVGRQRGGDLEIETEASRFLRAAQCQDEAHYHFLISAGATATDTFTVAENLIEDSEAFWTALLDLKEIGVGATMAAARQFAAASDLRLVEIAYQIGTTEAQHLALTRVARGDRLASDRAFAKWRFATAAEAVQPIVEAGYLSGEGPTYEFPGPLSRQCRGVFGLVPETTDDQLPPLASPVASPNATD